MTPEKIEQYRQRFESWVLRENPGEFLGRLDNGEYADLVVRSNWRVWLAAQSDADAGRAAIARQYPLKHNPFMAGVRVGGGTNETNAR